MNENLGASEEIRNPEKLNLLELPKATESTEEIEIDGGKAVLIKPEGFLDGFEIVVGARVGDPGDEVVWDKSVYFEKAGIDPQRIVGIKQAHTANVLEVGADSAGLGSTFKKGDEDNRITMSNEAKSGADAAWTKDSDLGFVIATADCAAVMVAGKDKEGKKIAGIAHAGIAGAQQDVVGNLLQDMAEKGGADISSLKIYIGPDIAEQNYAILSEAATDDQIDKARGSEEVVVREEGEEFKIKLTKISESFKNFKEKYGDKFKEIYNRELAENDIYYIDRNSAGELDLNYNVNVMIYLSLIGNGISAENIGFSEIDTYSDSRQLPSNRRTKETTGIFSVVKIG